MLRAPHALSVTPTPTATSHAIRRTFISTLLSTGLARGCQPLVAACTDDTPGYANSRRFNKKFVAPEEVHRAGHELATAARPCTYVRRRRRTASAAMPVSSSNPPVRPNRDKVGADAAVLAQVPR
jgi:hypothetical protein